MPRAIICLNEGSMTRTGNASPYAVLAPVRMALGSTFDIVYLTSAKQNFYDEICGRMYRDVSLSHKSTEYHPMKA